MMKADGRIAKSARDGHQGSGPSSLKNTGGHTPPPDEPTTRTGPGQADREALNPGAGVS
ncbi:hypothetical protein ACGFI3_45940 [Nonomuraea wenchangensis]|uniref:hypothetical protein n=1 Tax=Nonomuraea wenchangensis TaxID=568860 RepID=UPI00371F38C6